MGVNCCCLHVNYIVYKHFNMWMHIPLWNPTCVQSFRFELLMVFEIQGLKLKNNNNKKQKNLRNELFAMSPMLVVQFKPNFRYTYILTLAIILWCQKWMITESESANQNFRMYRHNGPRPRPSLYPFRSQMVVKLQPSKCLQSCY